MITKNKTFDCVKMKNAIQAQIYAETKDMTFGELKTYICGHLQENSFWKKINSQTKSADL